jgi:cytochrome P450
MAMLCCVQAVLDARPGTFDREKQLCDPFIQSGFDGVVAQNGETWKRHRRITSSAFG